MNSMIQRHDSTAHFTSTFDSREHCHLPPIDTPGKLANTGRALSMTALTAAVSSAGVSKDI